MHTKEALSWAEYDAARMRAVDTLISKIPPVNAAEFMAGCERIYNATAKVDPDVIFLPERGAAPLSWVLDAYEQRDRRDVLKMGMPIGTHYDVDTHDISGLEKPEKRRVIEAHVRVAEAITGGIERPMLIDEVQLGGTIRQAANFLYSALTQDTSFSGPLHLVAVQDNSNGFLTHKKASENTCR